MNLEHLIAQAGTLQKLAVLAARSHSQISQIRNRIPYHREGKLMFRQMGDKFARHLERIMGKPVGWMDQLHDPNEIVGRKLSADAMRIAAGIDDIQDAAHRRFVVAACMTLVFGSVQPDVAELFGRASASKQPSQVKAEPVARPKRRSGSSAA